MSFQNHIKQVAPSLSQIKNGQPAILLGNKVIVAGVGGNYVPVEKILSDSTSATVADISAGYITVSDSVVTLHDLTKGTTSIADKIYIPDTGVEEPDYAAGGTPQPVPALTGSGLIYGVIYNPSNSSPACQRVVKYGDTLIYVPNFPYMPAHNWKRCVMDDMATRHINYYLDANNSNYKQDGVTPSVLTGADGDVMVEIPITYWSVTTMQDGKILYLVSDQQFQGSQPHPFFYVSPGGQTLRTQYVGAYNACLCNSSGDPIDTSDQYASSPSVYQSGYMARSLKGTKPWTNATLDIGRTAIHANGGYQINALFFQYLMFMCVIDAANLDVQESRPRGYSYSSFKYQYTRFSGRCNYGNGTGDLYMDSTQDASIVWFNPSDQTKKIIQSQYRGIQNTLGAVWQFADGIVKTDSGYYMTKDCSIYSDTNYTSTYTFKSYSWPSSFGWVSTFDYQTFFPKGTSGSQHYYLSEYAYVSNSTGTTAIQFGGDTGQSNQNSPAYIRGRADLSTTSTALGFRVSA